MSECTSSDSLPIRRSLRGSWLSLWKVGVRKSTSCIPPALRPGKGKADVLEKNMGRAWNLQCSAWVYYCKLVSVLSVCWNGFCTSEDPSMTSSWLLYTQDRLESFIWLDYFILLEMCNIYSSRHRHSEWDGHKQQRLQYKVQQSKEQTAFYSSVCWEISTNINSPDICKIFFMIQQDNVKKGGDLPKAPVSQWQKWKQNPKEQLPAPSSSY